jgi:hypothetical protein
MIYNLDTLDRVINKVIRDLGLGHDEIPYQDFVEWAADALEHIGAYYQLEEKPCSILIEDYQGMLPCDFYKPVRMIAGCSVHPGSGGFYGGSLISALNEAGVDYESLPAYERFKLISVPGLEKPANSAIGAQEITNRLQLNKNLIGDPTVNSFTDMDYNINFNKITTSFSHGVIDLQYLAFATDDRGYPLVPDDVNYRDALFWKIVYHIAMRNPRCLQNPQLQNVEYCRQMWGKYCVQARAAANMPNLDMMIRMKNNWLRLHNVTDMDQEYFRDNGKQQRLNLDGRY